MYGTLTIRHQFATECLQKIDFNLLE